VLSTRQGVNIWMNSWEGLCKDHRQIEQVWFMCYDGFCYSHINYSRDDGHFLRFLAKTS
jgi:hypothetical protein